MRILEKYVGKLSKSFWNILRGKSDSSSTFTTLYGNGPKSII